MAKVILVVGSAPNARLIPCDHIYFANFSSTAFDKETVQETHARTTIVAAASAYFFDQFPHLYPDQLDPRRPRAITKDAMQERLDLLKSVPADEICAYAHRTRYVENVTNEDPQVRIAGPEEVFLFFQSIGATRELLWPLRTIWESGRYGPPIAKKDWRLTMREILRPRASRFLSSGYFRPSSGLTALALAAATYGEEARYILSGITFENRDAYGVGKRQLQPHVISSKHVVIDRILLNDIRKRYRVDFLDL